MKSYPDREYRGDVVLSDELMTCLAVVVDACRSVGAARLPFAIKDEELKGASMAVQALAADLGYGT